MSQSKITTFKRQVSSQTSFIYQENQILRAENKRLKDENERIKKLLDAKKATC